MSDYNVMMASFRENLEANFKKQAGVEELNAVQKDLLEKVATAVDEQLVLNGFDKQAESRLGTIATLGKGFMENAGKLGASALFAMGVLGAYKGIAAAQNSSLHQKFQNNLAKLLATNPILRQADATKVRSFAETIYKFGPHVASDANLLGPLLVNVIHGEVLDTQTIKSVVELEQRYSENNSFMPKNFF